MAATAICLLICVFGGLTGIGMVGEETPVAEYPLTYPEARQFCPPISGFFDEVLRTTDRVRGRTIRHQPNGGYGLAVVDKVGDDHLLHLGADVGWQRIGEPVYAVANGVVRVAEGAPAEDTQAAKPRSAGPLAWGNLVVIEHRLPDGGYATTIYGHLDSKRLVQVGDVVRAGQQIGTIGTSRVNGGYKPHLHFGVRTGRLAEAGRKLAPFSYQGKLVSLTIAEMGEHTMVLEGASELPEKFNFSVGGKKFEFVKHGGKVEAPTALLARIPIADFPIVGYGLSTEGWRDPTTFLRVCKADVDPAPFEVAQRRRQASPAPVNRSAGRNDRSVE